MLRAEQSKHEELKQLIKIYRDGLRQFHSSTYNETQTRVDFVNPFFELLGWDVCNRSSLPQQYREVVHEATVTVEEAGLQKNKKPDYLFKIGTEPFFYLETKRPSVNITSDRSSAFQLRRYGWSGNLKISVLTNFNDLYIYDCTIRPEENDAINKAEIAHYSFEEYENSFDEIYTLLSKEAVLSGEFERNFSGRTSAYRKEPFDEYFLNQIRKWRDLLGMDIAQNNPEVDILTLNISVQRILNRIIFLRICEDKNFESYENLKNVQTYDELKELFDEADRKYDSGIFTYLDEDRYRVSDSVLISIFQSLYYPNNSYEFSVVDPYIIGQIYELFLSESLQRDENGNLSCVKKPEIIDSQGTVNTPKNITDIIVEQTLAPLYEGKRIDEVEKYRIVDICCGSGNFLLSAYEYIINFYINDLLNNCREDAIHTGKLYRTTVGDSNYKLSYILRRDILSKNIWGVDIDPLAVEVTKFSLMLKALEGTSVDELNSFSLTYHQKILPNMDANIKNGNSLVDDSFASFDEGIYNNIALAKKIRMFNWNREFGKEPFDAVIGNPPYIRVQNMVKYSPEEYSFYRSNLSGYKVSASNATSLDKYYLFLERGISLLKENGFLGYIVPHKFMNIVSGAELRKILAPKVYKIIHFGEKQVFKDRSTYTCILVLSNRRQESFSLARIEDLRNFIFTHQTQYVAFPSSKIGETPWSFPSFTIKNKLAQIRSKCIPLKTIANIFVGVQTSADKIYIVKTIDEDEETVKFIDKNGRERKIEKGILRKSIYDTQLKKYEQIKPNSYIIFPYKNAGGKASLLGLEELRENYPLAFKYLESFRSELDARQRTNRTTDNWFAFGRTQSLNRFVEGEHLIWPVLSCDSNYVYDDSMIVFTGGGNGPYYGLEMKNHQRISLFYIQAILNHWLMEYLVKSNSSIFRGGYYSHGKQFISELPIFNIDFSNPIEKKSYDGIVRFTKEIMNLSKEKNNVNNSIDKRYIERSIDSLQSNISEIIDGLYGVKIEDINEER